MLQEAEARITRSHFSASPAPCGASTDFKDYPGLHQLWEVDPGKKWTKDREKKDWTGERESFVDTLVQKRDPFF